MPDPTLHLDQAAHTARADSESHDSRHASIVWGDSPRPREPCSSQCTRGRDAGAHRLRFLLRRQWSQKDVPRFRMGVSTVRIEKRIPLRSFLNVAIKAPEVGSAKVSQLVESSDDSI